MSEISLENLKTILKVYNGRARTVIEILGQDSYQNQALFSAITSMRAAFHNYITLSSLCENQGLKPDSDAGLMDLGKQAAALAKDVQKAIESDQKRLSAQIESTMKSRRGLSSYLSGAPQHHRFLKGT